MALLFILYIFIRGKMKLYHSHLFTLYPTPRPYIVSNPIFQYSKVDGLVKSLKRLFSVIPAEAGIQSFEEFRIPLDSRFHGNDDFLRIHQGSNLPFPRKTSENLTISNFSIFSSRIFITYCFLKLFLLTPNA
jgi:hypothetical protein